MVLDTTSGWSLLLFESNSVGSLGPISNQYELLDQVAKPVDLGEYFLVQWGWKGWI